VLQIDTIRFSVGCRV